MVTLSLIFDSEIYTVKRRGYHCSVCSTLRGCLILGGAVLGVGTIELFHPVIYHRKLSEEIRNCRRHKQVSLFHICFLRKYT